MRRFMLHILGCMVLYAAYVVWDPVFPFLYESGEGKKAIVIGATAGMGRETARLLMLDGYVVGCVGRRQARLDALKTEFGDRCVSRSIDMNSKGSMEKLRALIDDLHGCDLMVICISVNADRVRKSNDGSTPMDVEWQKAVLDLDLLGFWRAGIVARQCFERQRSGHLVGISSTSGLIGEAQNPAYSGAKAFIQRYLDATRNYMAQRGLLIYVTDIIPGFVDVEYEAPGTCAGEYWSVGVETAGKQIFEAIKARKKVAYVPRRWRLIAWFYRIVPDWLYNWVGGF